MDALLLATADRIEEEQLIGRGTGDDHRLVVGSRHQVVRFRAHGRLAGDLVGFDIDQADGSSAEFRAIARPASAARFQVSSRTTSSFRVRRRMDLTGRGTSTAKGENMPSTRPVARLHTAFAQA